MSGHLGGGIDIDRVAGFRHADGDDGHALLLRGEGDGELLLVRIGQAGRGTGGKRRRLRRAGRQDIRLRAIDSRGNPPS